MMDLYRILAFWIMFPCAFLGMILIAGPLLTNSKLRRSLYLMSFALSGILSITAYSNSPVILELGLFIGGFISLLFLPLVWGVLACILFVTGLPIALVIQLFLPKPSPAPSKPLRRMLPRLTVGCIALLFGIGAFCYFSQLAKLAKLYGIPANGSAGPLTEADIRTAFANYIVQNDTKLVAGLLKRPNVPADIIVSIYNIHSDPSVIKAALSHPHCPIDLKRAHYKQVLKKYSYEITIKSRNDFFSDRPFETFGPSPITAEIKEWHEFEGLLSYQEAQAACASLGPDWRLPSNGEFNSLMPKIPPSEVSASGSRKSYFTSNGLLIIPEPYYEHKVSRTSKETVLCVRTSAPLPLIEGAGLKQQAVLANWRDAFMHCKNLGKNYRLPTADEFETLFSQLAEQKGGIAWTSMGYKPELGNPPPVTANSRSLKQWAAKMRNTRKPLEVFAANFSDHSFPVLSEPEIHYHRQMVFCTQNEVH